MQQLKDFVPIKGGNKPGFCLQNVRLGYGIPSLYSNAITAWKNTEQHKDRNIPQGVDVPVYFSYKNDGHIGVRLSDGRFWSDGITFKNLEAYEATHEPVYLGWGESINKVKVLGEDMITKNDVAQVRIIMSEVEGWNGHDIHAGKHDSQIMGAWVGQSWTKFIYHGWTKQGKHRIDLETSIAELNKTVKAQNAQIAQLKAAAGNASEANLLGQALIKLLATLGYKKG